MLPFWKKKFPWDYFHSFNHNSSPVTCVVIWKRILLSCGNEEAP